MESVYELLPPSAVHKIEPDQDVSFCEGPAKRGNPVLHVGCTAGDTELLYSQLDMLK